MNWYCITNDIQRGPMTLEAMRGLIAAGTLRPDDYVWTPDFGNDWRPAGTVDDLFPGLNTPLTPPPVRADAEHPPLVMQAFFQARQRMRQLLFRPFRFAYWATLFFFLMMAGMGALNYAFVTSVSDTPLFPEVIERFRDSPEKAMSALSAEFEAAPETFVVKAARRVTERWDGFRAQSAGKRWLQTGRIAFMFGFIFLISTSIRAWGTFLVLHAWHVPRAKLQEALVLGNLLGPRLFRWKAVAASALLALFFAGCALFFFGVLLPLGRNGTLPENTYALSVASLALILGATFLFALLTFLADQLMAPVIYWRQATANRAFFISLRSLLTQPLAALRFILVFILFSFTISLCTGVLLLTLASLGFGIGTLPLFLVQFLLIPLQIHLRGFTLLYLAQWRPDLTQYPISNTEYPTEEVKG